MEWTWTSHVYGGEGGWWWEQRKEPGQAGPRERGGTRPARRPARGAAAATALAPGQAGPRERGGSALRGTFTRYCNETTSVVNAARRRGRVAPLAP